MSASEPPSRSSPIAPGYKLDRYEMLCPIAEGGMASVWVARLRGKRGFEKLVAIKTILPKFAQDPRFERMFLDEAGLAARIEHANVAQVLDLGEEHEVLYLAMELVDGDSLSKLLRVVDKKGLKIPIGVVLRVLADTCAGLHAAHEARGRDGDLLHVVHRDISPQNILVTMQGVAKLIDFGIAKARDRVSEDTSEGMLKGKIYFMAPEQAQGRKIDRRADIWAVGAILYYLLAGKPPFAGENELASLFLLSSGRPPLPLPPTVPPAVVAVVKKALTHDPEKRFATAAEMEAALEAAMVSSQLATTTAIVGAFVREHIGDRAKRRKEALDLALSAASQREKVAHLLERAGSDSASGHGVPNTGSGQVPAVDSSYATVLLGKSPARGSAPGDTPAEPSSATLGSAMASPVPSAGLPRKVSPVAVFVAVLVGMLALGVLVLFLSRPSSRTPVAAAPHASVAEGSPSLPTGAPPPTGVPAVTPSPSESASSGSVPWNTVPAASSDEPRPPPSAAAPSPARVVPRYVPPPKPASTTAPPPKKQRVNDGF